MPYFGHLWNSMYLHLASVAMRAAIQTIDSQVAELGISHYNVIQDEHGAVLPIWKTRRFSITLSSKQYISSHVVLDMPSYITLRDLKTKVELLHTFEPGAAVQLPHSMLKALECPDSLYLKTVGGSSPVAISSRWI